MEANKTTKPPRFSPVTSGIVLADCNQIITHANPAFFALTGYDPEDIIGKNCRVLQGTNTSNEARQAIRNAISKGNPCRVRILNYRKTGEAFWNLLTITPLFDSSGKASQYVGIQMIAPNEYIDHFTISFPWHIPENSNQKNQFSSKSNKNNKNLKTITNGKTTVEGSCEKTVSSFPFQMVEIDNDDYDADDYGENENENENFVKIAIENGKLSFVAETDLPTEFGTFRVRAYKEDKTGRDVICIIHGQIENKQNVVMRVHDQCFTSEVLHSLKCDCREQLQTAMKIIGEREEGGMIVYLQQEGRGIGLANKIKAYSLQQQKGLDTVEANLILGLPDDCREYGCIPHILHNLSISSIRLMTNNPRKIERLGALGISITGRVPIAVEPNSQLSANYLRTKTAKHGHILP